MEHILLSFHVKDVGVEGLTQSALRSENLPIEMRNFLNNLGAVEGFYLSTCNRTEYLLAFEKEAPLDIQKHFAFTPRIFLDRKAIVTHLLNVALSKDSVVFGESQILGQFKRAYETGLEHGLCGTYLSPLLNRVIREAKQVRSTIGLTQIHSSVSTVAGAKVNQRVGSSSKRILFVGSGETNTILASYLKKRGNHNFIWSSRGHQRAVNAAADLGGEVLNWDLVVKGMLPHCDVICVATHAKEILVDEVGFLNANPQMICDLAVPANADRLSCERLGITYYGIEELSEELNASQKISQELLVLLEEKITLSTEKIISELASRDIKNVVAQTVTQANRVWEDELQSILQGKLSSLSEEQKQALSEWSRKLVNKVNHFQIETLKQNVL